MNSEITVPALVKIRIDSMPEALDGADVIAVCDIAAYGESGRCHLWLRVELTADETGRLPRLRGGRHSDSGEPISRDLADYAAPLAEECADEWFQGRRKWRSDCLRGAEAPGMLPDDADIQDFFNADDGAANAPADLHDWRGGEVAFLRQQLTVAQANVGRMIGLAEREGATWWKSR